MNGILDHVARAALKARATQFLPGTPSEFLALRLAQKLNEPAAARHYADLTEVHSHPRLLVAYRRTIGLGPVRPDSARRFHAELERLNGNMDQTSYSSRLCAIRIERRAIATAVFSGLRLEDAPVRQLSSDSNKAIESAAAFISRVLEVYPLDSAAIELIPGELEVQRKALLDVITRVLHNGNVSVWQVPKKEVIEAFGSPALKSRKQLRDVISNMWPGVNGGYDADLKRDAVALGLYCQTERQFVLED